MGAICLVFLISDWKNYWDNWIDFCFIFAVFFCFILSNVFNLVAFWLLLWVLCIIFINWNWEYWCLSLFCRVVLLVLCKLRITKFCIILYVLDWCSIFMSYLVVLWYDNEISLCSILGDTLIVSYWLFVFIFIFPWTNAWNNDRYQWAVLLLFILFLWCLILYFALIPFFWLEWENNWNNFGPILFLALPIRVVRQSQRFITFSSFVILCWILFSLFFLFFSFLYYLISSLLIIIAFLFFSSFFRCILALCLIDFLLLSCWLGFLLYSLVLCLIVIVKIWHWDDSYCIFLFLLNLRLIWIWMRLILTYHLLVNWSCVPSLFICSWQ